MSKKLDNARNLYQVGIRDGRPREAVEAFTGDRYTQHSTGVPDGKEGFVAFFEDFIARNPVRHIDLVRTLEDGRHVFVHAFQSLNRGEAEWVTMDFFDTDADDRIIEHWDVIAAYRAPTPSGHTPVDGAVEVVDVDRTEANKAVVREMVEQVLMPGGAPGRVGEYIAETCIQHNPDVPDGLAPFAQLATSPSRELWYDEIVLLVGQGNFVATLCKARRNDQPLCQADLFRLEDGVIVEHWDNSEPVPPPEDWTNGGKF